MAKFLIIWISIKIRSLFINFWREEAKIFKSSANKTMTRNYDRIAQIGIDRDRLFLAIEVCIISRERSAVCSGRGGRNCTPTRICNRTAERSTWQFYMALFSFRCFPANCMLPWHRLYLHFHVGPDLHWFAWNIVLQQREMRGKKGVEEVRKRSGGTRKKARYVSSSYSWFRFWRAFICILDVSVVFLSEVIVNGFVTLSWYFVLMFLRRYSRRGLSNNEKRNYDKMNSSFTKNLSWVLTKF